MSETCDCCGREYKQVHRLQYAGLDYFGNEMYHCRHCHDSWMD